MPPAGEPKRRRGRGPGKRSILDAISEVLRSGSAPMTLDEIYQAIVRSELYPFKARDPLGVVRIELYRHSVGRNFPTARPVKYFEQHSDGRFTALDEPVTTQQSLYPLPPGRASAGTAKLVTVPTDDDPSEGERLKDGPSHTEIQWRLLRLGSEMGLKLWAPQSDRNKLWAGNRVGGVSGVLDRLPIKFDQATAKTIENIDVLWLDKHSIVAGFEVEHTTSIYSGLLRMSDLLAMQPNIEIKLYLVAPDEREEKFAREVARPTFVSLRKPVHTVCRFLPYSKLLHLMNTLTDYVADLRPVVLDRISALHDPGDEFLER